MSQSGYAIVRAAVLAGLAALMLTTHVFITTDEVRAKIIAIGSEIAAANDVATVAVADTPQLRRLQPPFALIAIISNYSDSKHLFSIAVDGVYICQRVVPGQSIRRVDCVVTSGWSAGISHSVAIKSPSTIWRVKFLELATYHAHLTGLQSVIVLPFASDRYTPPGPMWILTACVALFLTLVLLPPAQLGRRVGLLYGVAAGLILIELTLSMVSQWISSYRVVLSARTFAACVLVLLAPRLWPPFRDAARTGATWINLRPSALSLEGDAALACVIGAFGIAIRCLLSDVSIGSNDIYTWEEFGRYASRESVLWMYDNLKGWNHPPLMGYLVAGAFQLSEFTGVRFPVVFRLVPIAADLLCLLLLWKVWRRHSIRPDAAVSAVTIFSFSPAAILVSGYHGNTDPLVGLFVLGACYLVEAQGRYFWAGVALAAAVNVKLIPLVLAPVFLANIRKWPEAIRFCAGFSLGAIPFLPVVIRVGPAFYRNAIAYNSNFDHWGIPFFILGAERIPALSARAIQLHNWFVPNGRYLVIAVILALCAWSRWRRPLSTYQLAAGGLAAFLVLGSGFGVQYVAILGPVLVAASLGWGIYYAISAGAFIGAVYYLFGTPFEGPLLRSDFSDFFPYPSPWIGLLAWAGLVAFLISLPRARAAR